MSKIGYTSSISSNELKLYYLLNAEIGCKKSDMIYPHCGAPMVSERCCEYCGIKSKGGIQNGYRKYKI